MNYKKKITAAVRPSFRGAQVVSRAAASSVGGRISGPFTRVGLSSGGDVSRRAGERRLFARSGRA